MNNPANLSAFQNNLSAFGSIVEKVGESLADGHPVRPNIKGMLVQKRDNLEALHRLATTRDPNLTPEAHTKKLATQVDRFVADLERSRDWTHKVIRENLIAIDAQIKQKIDPNPNRTHATQIIEKFSRLNQAAQAEQMQAWIESKNFEMLNTVMDAPEFITNLPPDMKNNFTKLNLEKNAPEEFQAQQALTDTLLSTLDVLDHGKTIAQQYYDPGALASIQAREKNANDAQAAFDAQIDPRPKYVAYQDQGGE